MYINNTNLFHIARLNPVWNIVIDFYPGSGVARGEGASGGTRPGAQALGVQQHTFYSHFKRVLSRNLDQSMLKNAYFLENCKNRLSVGGSVPEPLFASGGWGIRPQTPALLLPPTITTLSSSFLVLNVFNSTQ